MHYSRLSPSWPALVSGLIILALSAGSVSAQGLGQTKITASDLESQDLFGQSVSVDGDYAVIGAPGNDQNDNGSAYIFRWDGASWVEEAKLTASDGAARDRFGQSVSISGDVVVVGTPADDANGVDSGSAYVFRRDGGSWAEEARLEAPFVSITSNRYGFGHSVAVDGDVIAVGTYGEQPSSGRTYFGSFIFRWDGSAWVQEFPTVASREVGPGGYSVALSGDVAVIGSGISDGRAIVYRNDGTSWVEEAVLQASDGARGDQFGRSVSVDGSAIVVGANAVGLDRGAAYVFQFDGSTWVEEAKFTPDPSAGNEALFGQSVSILDGTVVVGAPGETSRIGAAYVFRDDGTQWNRASYVTLEDENLGVSFGGAVSLHGEGVLVGARGVRPGGAVYDVSFGPALIASARRLSFPETGTGSASPLTVTVTNPGFEELAVSSATSSDDAFSASPSAFSVAPGGSLDVTVTFAPTTEGAYRANLTLVHNGVDSPETIGLLGDSRGPEISLSAGLLQFGTVAIGDNPSQTVTVSNGGLSVLEVASTTSAEGAFTASPSAFSVAPGESETVTVTFAPLAPGSYEADLVFDHNGATSPDALALRGFARGAELQVNRSTVRFSSTPPGETAARTIDVSNRGLVALDVTSVAIAEAAFSASPSAFSLAPGETETITVTFAPPAPGGYAGDLVFTHNGVTSPDTVAVRGDSDPTRLTFDPPSLAFGRVDIGTSSPVDVELSRSGPAASVTVTRVYASRDDFAVEVATPFTVEGPVTVPVAFAPTVGGPIEGYVYFEHDGTNEPDSIAVAGVGQYNARLTALVTSTVGTNFVNVVFRATDAFGRGLNIPAEVIDQDVDFFTVADDGETVGPTDPETFYQTLKLDEAPYRLRTVLLLDNSTSVGNDLPEIRAAARQLVDNMVDNQEVALYVFDSQISLLQDFTSDRDALRAAIDGITIGSPSTALYSGLVEGLDRWEDVFVFRDNGDGTVDIDIERGFLVLLSDGDDTAGGTTLSEVLAARSGRRVYAVGYGDVDASVLGQIGNAGVYTVDTADDLPAVFAEVQAEIENDAQSFYILNYSSPRRADQAHTLRVCLRDNTNRSTSACAQSSYNSAGFTDPVRGVYVNRTLENLNGVDAVEVGAGGTVITATTILGLNEPSYVWSSSDETQVTVEPIEGTNQAVARRVGPVGGTATITVTDVANSLSRSVNGSLVVPNEEAPSMSGLALRSVYPNPAHTQADVVFGIGASAHVRVALYDVLGRRVAVALDAEVPAGERTATLQLESLAAGVYVLFVEAEGVVETRQLTVVR